MANILHLTHRYWPVPGGSEQYLWQIAVRQAQAGHQVTVVTTTAYDLAYFWDARAKSLPPGETADSGVRIIREPVKHLAGQPWSFGVLRRLAVFLSRLPGLAEQARFPARWAPYLPGLVPTLVALGTEWQLVCGWNVTFDGLMAAAQQAAQRSRACFLAVPFLHLGEGPKSSLRRCYTMPHQIRLLQMADCLIAQTKIEADYLIQQGIASNRVAIVGAGIDPETLHGGNGAAFRQRHHIAGPIITAIGPQTFDKGAIHLLQAAVRLWRGGRDFTLVLAGPMMADFQRYWRELPAEDRARCRLLGPISDAEKRDLLAATDVLALPSRTESFGIVLLEAWFYGKPVIGAQAGAIPAVVEDGVDGRLVPFGDVPALAEAITEVLDDPLQAQRWGANGRLKTIEHHTWQAVYERFSAAIAGLV